jgi:PEP-CTERM motif
MEMINMLLTRFFLASAALIGAVGVAIAQIPPSPSPSAAPTPTPEPASLALLAAGVGGTIIARGLYRRRRNR